MNILISGVGGQGVLRASEILAEAANAFENYAYVGINADGNLDTCRRGRAFDLLRQPRRNFPDPRQRLHQRGLLAFDPRHDR